MAVIINELSLSGQYGSKQDFISDVRISGIILKCLNLFKIEILKGREFYACKITQDNTFLDVFYERTPAPEIQAFKSELLKIVSDPFWENNQKHTCNDSYKFVHTDLLCNYGLAEATQDDKIVISFNHQNYQNKNLIVAKNGTALPVFNIYNLETLQEKIIDLIQNGNIPNQDNFEEYLPMTKVVKNLGMSDVDGFVSGKNKESKIAIYKTWGRIVAILNYWVINRPVTNKNDRDVYMRKVNGKTCYLTIDTENGTFELFNENGKHLGEHNFIGVPTRNNPQSHKLNL